VRPLVLGEFLLGLLRLAKPTVLGELLGVFILGGLPDEPPGDELIVFFEGEPLGGEPLVFFYGELLDELLVFFYGELLGGEQLGEPLGEPLAFFDGGLLVEPPGDEPLVFFDGGLPDEPPGDEPLDEFLLGLLRLANPRVLRLHIGELLLRDEEEGSGRTGRTALGAADRVEDEETILLDADHSHDAAALDAIVSLVAELVAVALDRIKVPHEIHPRPVRNDCPITLFDLPCYGIRRSDHVLHRLFLLKVLSREALAVWGF